MRVKINEQWINIPSSLSEITLKQRIDYQLKHGNELDEMLKSIIEMPEGSDKEIEVVQFQLEKMYRTFAFFAGTTTEALKESSFINEISNIYYGTLAALLDDEQELELQQEFAFNGELWYLHGVELKNGDKMKFGELIDAKQVVKDMVELGKSKWEYMLPICAIYLRKKDEQYQESFLYEGSERLKLMEDLPMDIAMQVGFFFLGIMNTYSNSQYFNQAGLETPESIVSSIMSGGVGSSS